MATKSMAYDHPAYLVPFPIPCAEIAAAASSKSGRFCAPYPMTVKSVTATVITAGGTVNAIDLVRQASGGTALTTLASISNIIGTSVGGVTTNALMTGAGATLAQGDVIWAQKGAGDGVGVYGIGIEAVIIPGANVTA